MKFSKFLTIALTGALTISTITGCTTMRNMVVENAVKDTKGAQDPKKVEQFETKFSQVLDAIDNKKDYKKIPLDGTADGEWFIQQSFKLWDGQITKEQYITAGLAKFPEYRETFTYLADQFSK